MRLEHNQASASRWMLLVAAILFSTGGAVIKACALTPWQVASFRSGISAAVLLLLLPGARRGWSLRIVTVAIAYALTLVLFVLATRNTTAANAIFLQATAPVYLILTGPWLLKEPIRKGEVLQMLCLTAGMWLFFLDPVKTSVTAPNPQLGNLFAACSGFTWASTVLGLRWVSKTSPDSFAAAVLGNIFAFLFVLPMALPVENFKLADGMVLLYLGVFQVGLSYVLLTRAIRHVGALESSLILLVEPALNPWWAWLVQGEVPGAIAIAGAALIFGGTVTRVRLANRV